MNNSNFRIISILEGISFLLILGVTMPLKYYFENPAPNKFIGMAHGVLFVLYVMMAFSLQKQNNWNKQDIGHYFSVFHNSIWYILDGSQVFKSLVYLT